MGRTCGPHLEGSGWDPPQRLWTWHWRWGTIEPRCQNFPGLCLVTEISSLSLPLFQDLEMWPGPDIFQRAADEKLMCGEITQHPCGITVNLWKVGITRSLSSTKPTMPATLTTPPPPSTLLQNWAFSAVCVFWGTQRWGISCWSHAAISQMCSWRAGFFLLGQLLWHEKKMSLGRDLWKMTEKAYRSESVQKSPLLSNHPNTLG